MRPSIRAGQSTGATQGERVVCPLDSEPLRGPASGLARPAHPRYSVLMPSDTDQLFPTIHYPLPPCSTSDRASGTPGVPFLAQVFHPPDSDGTEWNALEQLTRNAAPRESPVAAPLIEFERSGSAHRPCAQAVPMARMVRLSRPVSRDLPAAATNHPRPDTPWTPTT